MPETGALKVLQLPGPLSAAFCGRYLRALGAEVAVLADAGAPPEQRDIDHSKRTIAPSEARPADFDVIIRCGAAAVIDGGPWGLAGVRAAAPSLITAAVTPFGESGPNRGHAGSDLVAIHAGGLGYGTPPRVTDPEAEYPLGIPGEAGEALCGLVLTLGILHALTERDGDGRGRHVEVSAQEAIASLMFNNIAQYLEQGVSPSRLASARPGARRPFQPCADGNVGVMANRPSHVRAWLGLLGEPGARLIAKLDGGATPAALAAEIAAAADAWTATLRRDEVTRRAQAAHVPVEPILSPAEVLASPQLKARGFWEPSARAGVAVAGHPFGPVLASEGGRRLPSRATRTPPGAWAGIEPRPGPLAGLRVLDFTWVFAGPIATRVLAALGATVIRVEQGGGNEPNRPFLQRTLHGDKLATTFDLRDAADLRVVQALAADADVVVENFSTGVMERHGLDWATLSARNERLVMVSISGMGRTGPFADHVMFGQLAQGYAGLTGIIGYPGGPGRGIEDGGFWSDPVAGYSAAAAALAALRERAVTGRGRRIDVSLVESTAATMFLALRDAALWGSDWPRGNAHARMAPHDVYRCAPENEDAWVAVAVGDDDAWRRLCGLLGRPELAADPAFATLAARQARTTELRGVIAPWTRRHRAEEASHLLQSAGIAAAPSRSTADLANDTHLRERGFFVIDAGRPAALSLAWRLHPVGAVSYGAPSPQGADTARVREVLRAPGASAAGS